MDKVDLTNDISNKFSHTYKTQHQIDFNMRVKSFDDSYDAKTSFKDYTSMTDRTFYRYEKGASYPVGVNILLSYSFILQEFDLSKVLKAMPHLAKLEYERTTSPTSRNDFSHYDKLSLKSKIHKAIYLRTMNSNQLDEAFILNKYGEDSAPRAIDDLIKSKCILRSKIGILTKGPNRGNFTSKELIEHLKHISHNEFNQEILEENNPANLIGFNALNLNTEGKLEFEKLFREFFDKAMSLESEYHGDQLVALTASSIQLDTKKEPIQ